MSDLIERLRREAKMLPRNDIKYEAADALEGAYDSLREHMAMVRDRDAEIERLQAALEDVMAADHCTGKEYCQHCIARDALEDEK